MMVHLTSEAMIEATHDPVTATLRIRFADGDWYSYRAVPAEVFAALLAADSHGRYFHDHIRDRYDYSRG